MNNDEIIIKYVIKININRKVEGQLKIYNKYLHS